MYLVRLKLPNTVCIHWNNKSFERRWFITDFLICGSIDYEDVCLCLFLRTCRSILLLIASLWTFYPHHLPSYYCTMSSNLRIFDKWLVYVFNSMLNWLTENPIAVGLFFFESFPLIFIFVDWINSTSNTGEKIGWVLGLAAVLFSFA